MDDAPDFEKTKIAYNIAEAAAAVGYSDSIIRRAIAKGDLVAHYRTSRGVILRTDLEHWIATAPTERTA